MKEIVILFFTLLLFISCKNKKESPEVRNYENTYLTPEKTSNTTEDDKLNIPFHLNEEKIIDKNHHGIEIVDGKDSIIQQSYILNDSFKYNFSGNYNFTDFWRLYKNKVITDFLDYYNNMEKSDLNQNFGIEHFECKLEMLLLSNSDFTEVYNQILNHKIILHTKYNNNLDTAGIELLNSRKASITKTTPVKMQYIINLNNEIKTIENMYYIFYGVISNIEKNEDSYIITLDDTSIYVDSGI